ncbi:MAG TPA: NAD(P)H-hydrate dehydratase [Gammaproteobacteria bacterium]|nr:NAD(P)H-hydrate dehydratase [Gammaproteobacteria bacterium]
MTHELSPNSFTPEQIRQLLPSRARDAHKGNFGHVVVIGGDYGMPGAVRMAAETAMRTGAGLVSVATHPEHISAIVSNRPEIMCHGIQTPEQLEPLLKRATTLIVGPGLGRSEWSKELFACAMQSDLPTVLDADGLYWLSQFEINKNNWVLTPHPGEAAQLLQTTSKSIQENRLGAIGMLHIQYNGVTILKGAGTLILGDSHKAHICNFGNPGMATGGMGDILSGIIGGLVSQKVPLEQAALLGVFIHAKAGDMAAKEHGERGLLATDLLPYVRKLVNS